MPNTLDLTPTKRNPLLGWLADTAQGVNDFAAKPFGYENPPGRMLAEAVGVPAAAKTLDRASYGERLTKGRGQTLQALPETTDFALALAGIMGMGAKAAPTVGKVAGKALENAQVPSGMAMQSQRGGVLMSDTETHLNALNLRLSNERNRLAGAKSQKERDLRTVWIKQIEKEIADTMPRGYVPPSAAGISDDDLMRELLGD